MKRLCYSLLTAIVFTSQVSGQAPTVNSKNWIANGRNFDVDVANNKIYLISDHYYELNLSGVQTYTNGNIDDTGQGTFDFGPAIEVGSDGVVHLINRDGGVASSGFNLMYSKREANGTWSVENNLVGSPVERNYVVDVVAMSGGEAVYAHSKLTTADVNGSVFFYKLAGTNVTSWGDLGSSGFYRVDADYRMERYQNKMHFASGKPEPWGVVYYMNANIGSSMPTDLSSSAVSFTRADDRRGQPDVKTDKTGNAFITYGDYQNVYFERYSSEGTHEISNKVVLNNLGHWHLDLGMSALGVSDTGDTLMVVGLRTDGSETGASCALQYTYSVDGGQTWSTTGEIPDHLTDSGEGRSRPRVHYYGHKFYVFYNNVDGGIAMSTIQLGDEPPPPPPVDLVDPVDLSLAQLTTGKNFDVEVANNRIYIISDHYYEYNLAGVKYAENTSVDDTGQGDLDFGPALSVGSGDEVHVITRNGGSASSGFNLKYSKKLSDGSWVVLENAVGTAVARNYVVDVVALDAGEALYAHGSEENVDGYGSVYFYNINGTGVPSSLGDLGRNDLYKVNSDFRMERYQSSLHLVTGKPFGEGTVYYMKGAIGSSLAANLTTDISTLDAGNGLSGQPDLRVDDSGNALLTYGSDGTVLFNRFSNDGSSDVSDKPIFDKLGTWKLNLGLSALGASPDGDTLLAVGLKTDGSSAATTCSLYYTWSKDGGENWTYPVEMSGFSTNGGEGRMRPRIRHYAGRFYIFFNNVNGGISVKTIKVHELPTSKASNPVILPASDSVTAAENISITSSSSDAIYYSYTDATPDMLSTPYTGAFTIDADRTIHAIAYRSGYLPSDVVSVSKKLKGDPPPPPPVLVDPVNLSLEMLSSGKNFDVAIANDRIYLISDHYYEYNLAGTKIEENVTVVDSAQGALDFGPAISVGSGGDVHVITRNSGSGSKGFSLKYSKKQTGAAFSIANSQIGIALPRNYVVDVVALDGGEALFAHSVLTTSDDWGSVYFYTLNGSDVTQLGGFGRDDLYRVDSDFRMERYQNKLHIATGKPDPDGVVYYMDATIGSSLPTDLASAPTSLMGGSGERGQPDLRIDEAGDVFISYGASETVLFSRFSGDGSGNVNNLPILNELGTWDMDLGLSAVESTPEGDTVFAVGLKTDDTKQASNSTLLYTFSMNGGQTWVYPREITGFRTNAGEGRMRPRVKFYRGRFYVFFNNVNNGGIAVKTFDLRGMTPAKTAAPVVLPAKDTVKTYDEITIEAAGSNAIYYSFQDASPDMGSTKYTGAFNIDSERTIYAIAYRSGYLPSDVVAVTKKVDEAPPLVDPVDLTKAKLSDGTNFDVVIDNDKIYMISDHYYEFDLAGDLLMENSSVTDLGQGTYDFGPALDVGQGGEVHIITRGEGTGANGFNLRYSKKELNGLWSLKNKPLGSPVARNYVVDVVAMDNGKALFAHSKQTTNDVWSSVFFYNLDGAGIESLGDLGTNDLYRIDADFRMERYQDQLYLATGRPDEDGAAHYMHAGIDASLPTNLAASQTALTAGEGRRGQPDLRIDEAGNVFLTYGSAQTILFERYSNDGSGVVQDLPIMTDLGTWHLDLGLSALASSPNGDTIMAVGLRTDGSKEASSCALLYTYSFDGGRNWVYPNEIVGYMTNGGEGRMRPRVKFYRDRFYIFYNNLTGGIAVTSIDLRNLVLLKTGAPFIITNSDSVFTYEPILMIASNSDAIYYSFSDVNPDLLATMYGGPFTIDTDRTIYARAYQSGYLPSDVVSVDKKVIITSTELKDALNEGSLELYPVPASSILSVETVGDYMGEVILRVFNHTGQEVHQEQIQKSLHELHFEIDVNEWTSGVYIMMMQSGSGTSTKRFVVE